MSVPPGPCRGFIAQHAILDHSCLPNTFICSHTAMATGWPLMLLLTHGDQETGQWRNAGPGPINTKGSPHSCSYGLKSQSLWLHFLPVFVRRVSVTNFGLFSPRKSTGIRPRPSVSATIRYAISAMYPPCNYRTGHGGKDRTEMGGIWRRNRGGLITGSGRKIQDELAVKEITLMNSCVLNELQNVN